VSKVFLGIDYAYTLQGWLKGVNSNTLIPSRDVGAPQTPPLSLAVTRMQEQITT